MSHVMSKPIFAICYNKGAGQPAHPHSLISSVSIGGRLITNFRFADDIVVNAEEEEEAGVLVDRLNTTTTR